MLVYVLKLDAGLDVIWERSTGAGFFQPFRVLPRADMRATESDLLYAIERRADGARAWLYVLLEHQSTAGRRDRWMRLRLLQYCCRIWERDRRDHPDETELRPIVPIVFYLGGGRWRHATEFSELFPEEMRGWPWLPRFEHLLIDHSETPPEAVRGAPKGRAAQLIMMAVYRVNGGALAGVAASFAAAGRLGAPLRVAASGEIGAVRDGDAGETDPRALCRGVSAAGAGAGRRGHELRRGDQEARP